MKRFATMWLLLIGSLVCFLWLTPAARAHDDHHGQDHHGHGAGDGDPWDNPAVVGSVQGDLVALGGALAGAGVFVISRRRNGRAETNGPRR